jgi:hypothetical protein
MVTRLVRISLNAAAILSLMLFVATVSLWVRSYFAADRYQSRLASVRLLVGTSRGGVSFICADPQSQLHFDQPDPGYGTGPPADDDWRDSFHRGGGFPGFTYVNVGPTQPPFMTRFKALDVRLWLATTLLALAPALRLYAMLRSRSLQRGTGHCSRCGYDLRATPNRCPECGTAPAVRTT